MITWARRNVSNAVLDLRTMVQMQDPNTGFIPEMIYWNSSAPPGDRPPFDRHSAISQMPVLAFSLRAICNATAADGGGGFGSESRDGVLAEFLPKLISYWKWWSAERDVRGAGLVR